MLIEANLHVETNMLPLICEQYYYWNRTVISYKYYKVENYIDVLVPFGVY